LNVRVKIVDQAGLREWRDGSGPDLDVVAKRKIAETGETAFWWHPDGQWFSWVCPGCGRCLGGRLGDEAVGGWDEPRWVNTGTRGRPTLTPSLACPSWRSGSDRCDGGHYWLRDGELVPA
jgi:hypothetical protein